MKRVWLLSILMGWGTVSSAQTGAFGAPIGKTAVGFRVLWTQDVTRSWQVVDSSGGLLPVSRTVRVHVWYPAVAGTGTPMTLRDYFEPPPPPGVPRSLTEAIRANDVGTPRYSFRGIYRGNVKAFTTAMATVVRARNAATPRAGKHPVVVYSVGQNDFSQDAIALAEWLASNGYVVVSVPHLGTNPRRLLLFVHDPLSYETQLRDLELGLQKGLELGFADRQRILAIGHSYGGIYALLLAMRSNAIRGVIGLDPTYVAQRAGYEYDLRKFPYFDPELRVPIVTLRRRSGMTNDELLNTLTRAERLEIAYTDLMHGDFTTVAFLRRDLPDSLQLDEETKVRSPRAAADGATAAFHQVLASAAAVLDHRPLENSVLATAGVRQTVARTPSIAAPTTEELYWTYKTRGLEGAKEAVAAARRAASGREAFVESRALTIARELGYSGKDDESLDMFRIVAFMFPDSSSAQLAAGGALLGAGLKTESRPLFERALQLDPGNRSAQESLEKAKE